MKSPSVDLLRVLLSVLFFTGLIVTSVWIMYPFLPALIWATLLVVSTWSLMLLVQKKLGGKRGLAVGVMIVGILLLVILPVALATTTIMDNADALAQRVESIQELTIPETPAWVESVPIVGSRIEKRLEELRALAPEELRTRVEPYAKDFTRWMLQKAGNLAVFFLHLLLTVILAAVLYVHGEHAAAGIQAFARRLTGASGDELVVLAGQAIRAVALGVVVTAVVQSALGGIGLAVAGVPYAAVLTAIMFVLAVAQIGAGPVLLFAVFWMYTNADAVPATIFLAWAIFVGVIDNVMRPLLIKAGADLPLLLIFAGVIGGLVTFGVVGLFVGPVVLAVTYTVLSGWIAEHKGASDTGLQ